MKLVIYLNDNMDILHTLKLKYTNNIDVESNRPTDCTNLVIIDGPQVDRHPKQVAKKSNALQKAIQHKLRDCSSK